MNAPKLETKTLIVCLFVLFDAPCFAEDGPVWFNPKTKRLEFRGDPVNGYAQRLLRSLTGTEGEQSFWTTGFPRDRKHRFPVIV